MCGRFYVDDETAREIEKVIRQVNDKINRMPKGDICPSKETAVISAYQGSMLGSIKRWGFPGFQTKNLIINARAETVLQKKLFSESVLKRRLIIPAGGFYEWNPAKEKIPFSPLSPDQTKTTVLFMAGFYNHFAGEDRFVILTTAANASMKPVHDRMPLTLEPYELDTWLFDDKAARELLHKIPSPLDKKQDYLQQTFSFL
ncbi:MAG: SOS response-associated peptidase [Suilimivivens sp.]